MNTESELLAERKLAILSLRKNTPFDALCFRVMDAKDRFRHETSREPKYVFLGNAETRAFVQIPPWQDSFLMVG